MKVDNNTVVSFHYRLSESSGDVLEDSHNEQPSLFLVGHDNLLPALEQAFIGREAGEQFSVTLTQDQAYGRRKEGATQRVPIKHLQNHQALKNRIKPGMKVSVHTEQGPWDAVVIKAGKFNVDIDSNHPYAGKTLVFDIEILEVRAAAPDELAHGHAHGVGGHQH